METKKGIRGMRRVGRRYQEESHFKKRNVNSTSSVGRGSKYRQVKREREDVRKENKQWVESERNKVDESWHNNSKKEQARTRKRGKNPPAVRRISSR